MLDSYSSRAILVGLSGGVGMSLRMFLVIIVAIPVHLVAALCLTMLVVGFDRRSGKLLVAGALSFFAWVALVITFIQVNTEFFTSL
jgi:hypothetical protein